MNWYGGVVVGFVHDQVEGTGTVAGEGADVRHKDWVLGIFTYLNRNTAWGT